MRMNYVLIFSILIFYGISHIGCDNSRSFEDIHDLVLENRIYKFTHCEFYCDSLGGYKIESIKNFSVPGFDSTTCYQALQIRKHRRLNNERICFIMQNKEFSKYYNDLNLYCNSTQDRINIYLGDNFIVDSQIIDLKNNYLTSFGYEVMSEKKYCNKEYWKYIYLSHIAYNKNRDRACIFVEYLDEPIPIKLYYLVRYKHNWHIYAIETIIQ